MELQNELSEKNITKTEIKKIESSEINRRIDFLGQKLNIPRDQLDKARNTEVLIVDRNTFFNKVSDYASSLGLEIPGKLVIDENERNKTELVFKAMGTSIEEVSKRRIEVLKKFIDEYSLMPGISYYKDGINKVLINSDEIKSDEEMEIALNHELLHSIGQKSEIEGGFSNEGSFHFLNEAVVQLMVIRINNSDLKWPDFINKYLNGGIKNDIYDSHIKLLLAIVQTTSLGKGGLYDFDEITKMYFDNEYDGVRGILFKMNLFNRVPEKLGSDENFKENLIKKFENWLEGDSIYNQKRQLETNPTALKAK